MSLIAPDVLNDTKVSVSNIHCVHLFVVDLIWMQSSNPNGENASLQTVLCHIVIHVRIVRFSWVDFVSKILFNDSSWSTQDI